MSPPTSTPNLDGEADDAPHHFYTMRNILGQNPMPTLTDMGIVEDFWQQYVKSQSLQKKP
jgi:hypothetical protein